MLWKRWMASAAKQQKATKSREQKSPGGHEERLVENGRRA
jgi:hypothetical protein